MKKVTQKRGIKTGTSNPDRKLKMEEGPSNSEKAHHSVKISWDRNGPSGDQSRGWSVKGKTKSCMHGLCHSPAHPSLNHVSPVTEGSWVLEHGDYSEDSGREPLFAVKRQPGGAGVRSSTAGKVCR